MNLEEYRKWYESYETTVVDFSKDGWTTTALNRNKPSECGLYLTMRLGLNGVYCCLDEWKELDGHRDWQLRVLDGSSVIAYKSNRIEYTEVNGRIEHGN